MGTNPRILIGTSSLSSLIKVKLKCSQKQASTYVDFMCSFSWSLPSLAKNMHGNQNTNLSLKTYFHAYALHAYVFWCSLVHIIT